MSFFYLFVYIDAVEERQGGVVFSLRADVINARALDFIINQLKVVVKFDIAGPCPSSAWRRQRPLHNGQHVLNSLRRIKCQ